MGLPSSTGGAGMLHPCGYQSEVCSPYFEWEISITFSVPSCPLARSTHSVTNENHYVGPYQFNWNKMSALLSWAACAGESG